jgi:hypothetical protein
MAVIWEIERYGSAYHLFDVAASSTGMSGAFAIRHAVRIDKNMLVEDLAHGKEAEQS